MLNKTELANFNKQIAGKDYDRLPIIFNALGDHTRCKIARVLIKKGKLNLSVNNIADIVGISQSSTSQHLKILEVTGIIIKRTEGRRRYYSINKDDPIVVALVKSVM